ncbi:hypothetical protein LMG29542_01753 [Paraburkholderia humisilvae]|uniref:Helix-turn-helix domain-containing protein n=1 Tax=Paraburkholderia humisilvae TaxID=627669 RepID=A0A6J5DHX5_9BURK|nr:hypothetical protein LMG29542_01753 [Paraburkholderia humisilvae]
MATAKANDLMSVGELAQLLNVTASYVRKKLLRKHVLRPVTIRRGRKYASRTKAEAYCAKRKKVARRALRGLARVSQEAGLYRDAITATNR